MIISLNTESFDHRARIILSVSPLDSYFKIISGLDYDILRVLVPQIIHVGGVDFDNRIASFKTGNFRRRTAINLQSKQTDSYSCQDKSGLTNYHYTITDYNYHLYISQVYNVDLKIIVRRAWLAASVVTLVLNLGSIFTRRVAESELSSPLQSPDSRATIFKCTRVITPRMSDTVHSFTLGTVSLSRGVGRRLTKRRSGKEGWGKTEVLELKNQELLFMSNLSSMFLSSVLITNSTQWWWWRRSLQRPSVRRLI